MLFRSNMARLSGSVGAQSDKDIARQIATSAHTAFATAEQWVTGSADPPEDAFNMIKKNIDIIGKNLISAQEKLIQSRVATLQQDARLGKYFKPGGSGYNSIKAAYPDVIKGVDSKNQADSAKASVSAASAPIRVVTRKEIVDHIIRKNPGKFDNGNVPEKIIQARKDYLIKTLGAGNVQFKD